MKQIVCNKINKRKIRKIKDIRSEKEWIEAVYTQFGFDTIDALQKKVEEFEKKEEWYMHFYWSKKVEDEWMRLTLKQFEPMTRRLIERGMWVMILNWFPTSVRKDVN